MRGQKALFLTKFKALALNKMSSKNLKKKKKINRYSRAIRVTNSKTFFAINTLR